jgi:hypothetical protein
MLRRSLPAIALCLLAACMHQVNPTVTPAKIPPVTPPIGSRALLVISPSFSEYLSESSSGMNQFRYHYGEAASKALSELVTNSFSSATIRQAADADVLPILAGPADTSTADVLLVPAFESAGAHDRFLDIVAEVKLRMSVRSFQTGATFTWTTLGGTARVISSRGGLTGSALEEALHAMSDSIAAHRAELEVHGNGQ